MHPLDNMRVEGFLTEPIWIIVKEGKQVSLSNGNRVFRSQHAAEAAIRECFKEDKGSYSVIKCSLVPIELSAVYDDSYTFLFRMEQMNPRQASIFVRREMERLKENDG